MSLEIIALSKELKSDYLSLFDNMVHKENPEWSKCYCNDYHFLGDVVTCTHAMSREMIIDRIEEGELQGYLVYDGDKVIGWCNANNRTKYQRLMRDYDLDIKPEDKVCSIVCFLIHPDYRRQGLSHQLLVRVISDYSNWGYDYLEAYPRKGESSTKNFNGHVELYRKNGFKIIKEKDNYYVMRKNLNRNKLYNTTRYILP